MSKLSNILNLLILITYLRILSLSLCLSLSLSHQGVAFQVEDQDAAGDEETASECQHI